MREAPLHRCEAPARVGRRSCHHLSVKGSGGRFAGESDRPREWASRLGADLPPPLDVARAGRLFVAVNRFVARAVRVAESLAPHAHVLYGFTRIGDPIVLHLGCKGVRGEAHSQRRGRPMDASKRRRPSPRLHNLNGARDLERYAATGRADGCVRDASNGLPSLAMANIQRSKRAMFATVALVGSFLRSST